MLVILFLLFQQAQAQDFVIVHDLLKDTTSFYRIGKAKDTVRVSEIGFRKPGRISLEVDNFNPFYWNAKVTTRPVEESGSIGMFMNSMTSVLGISGFPTLTRGGDKEKTKKLKALYNQLEELGVQLKELKYNIQKPASEIKSEARKIGATVIALIGKDSLNAKEMRLTGKELDKITSEIIPEKELNRLKNKIQTSKEFQEQGLLNRAMSLSYHELLGDANGINEEQNAYSSITSEEFSRVATTLFSKNSCSLLKVKSINTVSALK